MVCVIEGCLVGCEGVGCCDWESGDMWCCDSAWHSQGVDRGQLWHPQPIDKSPMDQFSSQARLCLRAFDVNLPKLKSLFHQVAESATRIKAPIFYQDNYHHKFILKYRHHHLGHWHHHSHRQHHHQHCYVWQLGHRSTPSTVGSLISHTCQCLTLDAIASLASSLSFWNSSVYSYLRSFIR